MKMLQSICFMRLHTAGIVVGWLGLVGSFMLTIMVTAVLGFSDVISERIAIHVHGNHGEIHFLLIVGCSFYLTFVMLNVIASGLLIAGAMKERHLMLLPWLINSAFGIVVGIIYKFFMLCAAMSDNGPFPVNVPVLLFTCSAGLVWQLYIYYGIYSLYKHIQLSNKQKHPLAIQSQDVSVQYKNEPSFSYSKM